MQINTKHDWNKLVAAAKKLCAEKGVTVKNATMQRVLAETFGKPHENALLAALPLTIPTDNDIDIRHLADEFVGTLSERVKPPLEFYHVAALFDPPPSVVVAWQPTDDPLPLFAQYDGQHQIQPAYISLNIETAEVDAGYSGEIGNAVPASVFHGIERRYSITGRVLSRKLELILGSSELLELLGRVLRGSEIVWDGSNYVGQLTQDAQEAEDGIEHWLQSEIDPQDDCGDKLSTAEYLVDCDGDLGDLVGDHWDIAELLEQIKTEAREFNGYIQDDLEDFTGYLRDRADEEDEDLDALFVQNAKRSTPQV